MTEEYFALKQYEGRLEGQNIVLHQASITGTVLERCTLHMADAKFGIVGDARLVECEIIAKKTLRRYNWAHASLERCKFRGTFDGNDFGGGLHEEYEGKVVGCDFTSARLLGCRFFSAESAGNVFAGWPTFVVYPDKIGSSKERIPESLRNWFRPATHLSFSVYDAKDLATRAKVSVGQIKKMVEELSSCMST